ncbi:glycerate kinase [Anaerobacillus isosaccharinicus]|uniref:Glycerate kinase n=1 Tax=Anaerobacillus isosaccharinicus TaxID=1532552 RepID=A0A1S2M6V2_9BACI|nr:glycerate kinase [Anaerobacillus isosaccharinicus]MBA5585019.1 glycerate kinase [Anaerobacillus isosaccharinicus]QOY36629.1 glycerate kinase [Anaerobacillus isosaccharinicus]
MKVVIAIDSFKGCCTTMEAADAVERGLIYYREDIKTVKVPIADGGEGTVDTLVKSLDGKYVNVEVLNPLGRKVKSKYGILPGNIAVIEMAAASGLPLISKSEYNPLITTTYGTGELIRDALDKGCRTIYIGLGGSATNDGGVGMAQSLGVSFKDKNNQEIGFGGAELKNITTIDTSRIDARINNTEMVLLSDVTNPLCGENGASAVYGPQKGATSKTIAILDSNLRYFGGLIKEQLSIDILERPGSGAAGGLGAGLFAFCNAKSYSGIEKIMDLIGLEDHLKDADLVFTGEGRIDFQTINGKVPIGVARKAKKFGVPVIAIVGSIGEGAEIVYNYGIDAIVDIVSEPISLDKALEAGISLIERATERTMRIWDTSGKSQISKKVQKKEII